MNSVQALVCTDGTSGQTCSLRKSWRYALESDDLDDESEPLPPQKGQLVDALSKLREKLMTAQ